MSKRRNEIYRQKHNLCFYKYELTDETKFYKGQMLHRIRALKDLPTHGVKKGDLGGWIQSPFNLSNKGECWIKDEAKVYEKGSVKNNSLVSECAEVKGGAIIMGQAVVKGFARVTGGARVMEDAVVQDFGLVYGYAKIRGKAVVCERGKVYADSIVDGDVVIDGNMAIAVKDDTIVRKSVEEKKARKAMYREKAKAEKGNVIHGYYGNYKSMDENEY